MDQFPKICYHFKIFTNGFPLCAQMFPGFGETGFHMSFGIGAFPFGFFTTVFNANDPFHRAGKGFHTGFTGADPTVLLDIYFCILFEV